MSVNVPKMSTTRTEDYSNVAPQLTAAMLQQLQRPLPQLNLLAAQFSSPMMYGTAQVPKSAAPVPQYSSYLPTPPDMTVESALAAKCREVQRSPGNPTVPHRTALTARHCTALLCILAHAAGNTALRQERGCSNKPHEAMARRRPSTTMLTLRHHLCGRLLSRAGRSGTSSK